MQSQTSLFRQSALDRLSTPDDLDELMHVASPRYWLVLVALAGLLVTAIIWSAVTMIPTTVAAVGALGPARGGLQAIVFAPADKAAQVRPGMAASVTIPTTSAVQPLTLAGRVTAVADTPADQATLLRALGGSAYVNALTAGGELVSVHVALTRKMGLPAGALQGGMALHAVITVARQRVIQLVIP